MPILTPAIRKKIEDNLFPRAHGAIEDWDSFPWHTGADREIDTWVLHSSQALAIDVMGTIKVSNIRDAVLDRIAGLLGLPTCGGWEVHLEWIDDQNRMRETGMKTQVDTRASNLVTDLFFEGKFTEGGGPCSQPGYKSQCNRSYEMQVNPVNNVANRCALSGKGIRYWDVIPHVFDIANDVDYPRCPFADSWYQWMRNLTLCFDLAQSTGRRPGFIVAYADHQDLKTAKEIRSPEWTKLINRVRAEAISLQTLSYQSLIKIAKSTACAVGGDEKLWEELEKWVDRKISTVVSSRKR